jgi:hypothetical protein
MERRQEGVGELDDVVLALAQRRDPNLRDRESVVKVLPERARLDSIDQAAIRRGDQAEVDLPRTIAADRADLTRFERPKELRLELDGQLSELVEEEGPALRLDEETCSRPLGAGECALLVTEELALYELRRDRPAVDDDERAFGASRPLVDAQREDLLADPVLAFEQERDVGLGGFLEVSEEVAHRRRGSERAAEARGLGDRHCRRFAIEDQPEHGAAERQLDVGGGRDALDANTSEPRPVLAPAIADEDAVRSQLETKMLA